MKLEKNFFNRSAEEVARELLGKVLVRRIDGKLHRVKVIETEAYLSDKDETSKENYRSSRRFNLMWEGPGVIFTYLVHNHVMFCISTREKEVPESVFFRAFESLNGDLRLNGPGILTKSLLIDNRLNGKYIDETDDLWIEEGKSENFEIVKAIRIGLKEKIPKLLRFYIKDNGSVSQN